MGRFQSCFNFAFNSNLRQYSADNTVKLWDRRKLGATGESCCVHTFSLHTEALTTVQWCPDQKGVFASGGDDGYLNIWDASKIGAAQTPEQKKAGPPEMMFQHAGHRSGVRPAATAKHSPCFTEILQTAAMLYSLLFINTGSVFLERCQPTSVPISTRA